MQLIWAVVGLGALERPGQQRVRERLPRDPLRIQPVGLSPLLRPIGPGGAVRAHIAHVVADQKDRRVPQPYPGTQVQDVIRRDPRLRQPTDHQQLPHMASVRAVALGALLVPAAGCGLGRLSKMHDRTNAAQLLSHEAPASRLLQPSLELLVSEALAEPAHTSSVRRRDRDRDTSPVSVSIQSAVICALWWSSPITIVIPTASSRSMLDADASRTRTEEGVQATSDGPPAHATDQVTPAPKTRTKVDTSSRRTPERGSRLLLGQTPVRSSTLTRTVAPAAAPSSTLGLLWFLGHGHRWLSPWRPALVRASRNPGPQPRLWLAS